LAKTVLNGVGTQIKRPKKISTIPAEDGGDQSSIAQTSRPEITQSQIEGFYVPNFDLNFSQKLVSYGVLQDLPSSSLPHNLLGYVGSTSFARMYVQYHQQYSSVGCAASLSLFLLLRSIVLPRIP
jgi:hypothetical protein